MPFIESLADFYDENDFATLGIYSPVGGGGVITVKGVFDSDYVEPFGQIEGKHRAYRTWAAQYPARPSQSSTLTINAVVYRVKNIQEIPPNGAEYRLFLEKTS